MVKEYYCHRCGDQLGLIPQPLAGKVVRSTYQYEKYHKHTVPDSHYSIQSVFSDPSTAAYATYVVNAELEGAVEVDEQRRRNIVWAAGHQTGFRYECGRLIRPTDAVKVVLSSSTGLVHAYPENSTSFSTGVCAQCGGPIVY